jgi:hypothetical protein
MKKILLILSLISVLLFFFGCSLEKATTDGDLSANSRAIQSSQIIPASYNASEDELNMLAIKEFEYGFHIPPDVSFGEKIALFFSQLGGNIGHLFGAFFASKAGGFVKFVLISIPTMLLLSLFYGIAFDPKFNVPGKAHS